MSLDINTKKAKKNAWRITKERGIGASRIRVPGGYLNADVLGMLQEIAKSRHCLVKGNEYDTEKAAKLMLDDFRNGRLGRITLEFPDEMDA